MGSSTNIVRNARYHDHPTRAGVTREEAVKEFDRITRTTPERAAEVIHAGVKAGRSRILVGPDAYFFDVLARATPTHYFSVLAALDRAASLASRPGRPK